MPRLLRTIAGRLLRTTGGRLASDGCAADCCGPPVLCANAVLCENTPGYDDLNPKLIAFPMPEDGRLCTQPPGPWLVSYKGYCYQPLYNEDGTLKAGTCATNGVESVWVPDPAAELSCLGPNVSCIDSPCVDEYHAAECCERRTLLCNAGCDCTGAEVCDCGKRFIAFVYATDRERSWNVQYVDGYGELCDDRVRVRQASWVTTYWGTGNPCPQWEHRGFGGTYETWFHGAPCYGAEFTTTDYTEWTGGYKCQEAWLAAFHRQYGSDGVCTGSHAEGCTASNGGTSWSYTGFTHCDAAQFSGWYEEKHEGDCIVKRRIEWESFVYVTRLVECDPAFAGEPPSLADLGLF